MIKVVVPNFLEKKNILNDEIISDVCYSSFGESEFIKEIEKRENGRYIKLERDNEIHYVCLSAIKVEGRNTFLSQYLATVYRSFLYDVHANKKMEVYLLNTSEKAYTPYQQFVYRCCKTLGIKLLNVYGDYSPFSSFVDMKMARNKTSNKNKGNKSSYFNDTGEVIELFAKCFGANGKESVFLALVLKCVTERTIKIYEVAERNVEFLVNSDREMLMQKGIDFGRNIGKERLGKVELNKSEKELRNQPAFRLNLFEKFGDKKCYLCDCDIDHMIIASHIHRVTDIKNDVALSDDEKKKQIIDGDNGLWLCANHDKLFEYGLIFFNNKDLVLSDRLNDTQKNYVKNITAESSIKDCDYNSKMSYYLELHKARAEQFGR